MSEKTVPFGDTTIEIVGLSTRKLCRIVGEYPGLLNLVVGHLDLGSLVVTFPDAAQKIVAEGTRASAGILARFDGAPIGEQVDLLSEIFDLTFRGDKVMPFITTLLGRPPGAAVHT